MLMMMNWVTVFLISCLSFTHYPLPVRWFYWNLQLSQHLHQARLADRGVMFLSCLIVCSSIVSYQTWEHDNLKTNEPIWCNLAQVVHGQSALGSGGQSSRSQEAKDRLSAWRRHSWPHNVLSTVLVKSRGWWRN